jgi:hypothetical protein
MNKPTRFALAALTGALLLGLNAGCTKKPDGPATSAELPGNLREAFKDGSAAAKQMADAAATALEKQDRAQAFTLLNGLSTAPDVTPEQRQAASRAAAAMRERLAKEAAQGDQEAAALMQAYRSSK